LAKIDTSFAVDVKAIEQKASRSLDGVKISEINTDKVVNILMKTKASLTTVEQEINPSIQEQVDTIKFPSFNSPNPISTLFNLSLSVGRLGVDAFDAAVKEEMAKFSGTTVSVGDLVVAQFGIRPEAVIGDSEAFNRSVYNIIKSTYSKGVDVGNLGKANVGIEVEGRVDPDKMKIAVENALLNVGEIQSTVGNVADGYFGVSPHASLKQNAVGEAVNEAMTLAVPQSSFTKEIMLSLNPVIDAESTKKNISDSMTIALQKIGGVNVSGNIPIAPVSASAAQQQVSVSPEVLTQMMSSLVNLKNISSIGSGPSVNVQQNMNGENSSINVSNIKVNVDDMVAKIAGDIKSGVVSAVKQGITSAMQELANNT
jgi:hypothetical protein